jgi:uncharacterized phiE125 gp8 family phage protein
MSPIGAKVITRETARLLSIETLRSHCEVVTIDTDSDLVESHPDDALLLAYLDAATDHAERFTGRALLLRTFEFALDDFPRWRYGSLLRVRSELHPVIEIPYPPFVEAVSFTYGDDSDSELEASVDYLVDDYSDKAVLRPVSSWPSVTAYPNLVKFRYRAGYSSEVDPDSDALTLPGGIRAAVLLMVSHLYANREASSEKAMAELPLGVEALLRPWRVLVGMA